MVKLYELVRYDYIQPKDVLETMGYFLSREDVNKYKKSQEFKSEYKMKTIEHELSQKELAQYLLKEMIGLTPMFEHLYDVL